MQKEEEDAIKDPETLERALSELQMLKEAVKLSPVYFAIYDANDRLAVWNQKYEDAHPEAFENHRTQADARELTYRQLISYEVAKSLRPEDRESELNRRVAAQRKQRGTPVDQYYDSVGHMRVYKYPLSSGAIAGFAIDISDLINTQAELSKAREESNQRYYQLNDLMIARNSAAQGREQVEERYRSLVAHAPDGITVVDLDSLTFVEDVNPRMEELCGWSRSELLHKRGPKDISPEFQPDGRTSQDAAIAYMAEAFNEGTLRCDWILRNANDVDFPCQITLIRFPHPTRRMVRASIVDLTDQKQAEQARLDLEQKLAQSQRLELIGQMTGGVAHDFNNVLGVLMSNLELIEEKSEDPEIKAIINSAMDAAQHGAGLTRAMLNYSRQAPLHPETFKLSEVVRRMESLISRAIPSRISISMHFIDGNSTIAADLSNTESAILNLVLNARDAIPKDGRIEISTASVEMSDWPNDEVFQPGPYIVLTIRDTGEGIAEDALEKIFEPFYTTKGLGQHSGLGLSMVQGFMTQSGGYLHVESQLEVGTTIKLYFPAIFESDPTRVDTIKIKTALDRVGRIMLVEDNETLSQLMELNLKQQGLEVLTANSTDSALAIFDSTPRIDLLITDIAIPGSMQGPQLARHFKKSQPELPVIFVSGYSFGLETIEAGLLESDVLLTKPVRRDELIAAVNKMLTK